MEQRMSDSAGTNGTDRDPPKLPYSPGFDGLRAIAALAVMLYHLKVLHATGGFLGVSIFFCLSGFLITSLLLQELRVAGRIDLRGFWRRRVFRILPLLGTVTAAWALWSLFDGSELAHRTLAGARSSALFVTNFAVARQQDSAGLLNGNWSVVFEEQFYLAWPPVLMVLWSRLRRERAIAWIVAGAAALVMAHRYVLAPTAPWSRIWFSPDTQVDAVLAGCAVALGLQCRARLVSVGAGVALVGLLFVGYPSTGAAQQVIPAVVLCTALVLPYLKDHAGVLGWPPFVALGKRSYGLYLWGGPIIVLLREHLGVANPWLLVISLPATLAVSEITYRWIEVPLRRFGRRRAGGGSPSDRRFVGVLR